MTETATAVQSALTWFEFPTVDFDRACRFYDTILATPLNVLQFGPGRIATFPYAEPGVGGCLDEKSESRPSATGAVVYLPVHGRLDRALELVPDAGGRVVVPKTAIPGVGFVAHIIDSEGNRVGLHSKT